MDHALTIITHLFSVGKLTLPGIGRLCVIKMPAKRMVHESKIYGPTLLLEFQQHGIEETTADSAQIWDNAKVQKSVTKIINDLLNFGESSIVNFGRFHKDENGRYSFDADPELKKTLALTYPDLAIKILTDKKKQAEKASPGSALILGTEFEKKKKIGWFFPLLALIATSLLLACLVTCFIQKKFDKTITPYIDQVEQSNITNSGEVPITSDSIVQSNTDTSGTDETPDTSDQALMDSFEQAESLDTSDDIFYDEFDVVTDANFEDIENLSLDYVLQESAAKRLSYDKPCIIVVGSYLRRDLLNKMVRRLNQLEHNIYIEKYGSFYRTAIIYDCNQINTKIFLSQVREEIEPKAWILEY